MQMPLELEFKNMPPSAALERLIRNKVAKLERFYDRIIGCRVVVGAPHHHHHQGSQFHVHIRLIVPDSILVTSEDEGYEDAHIAVSNAFDAIRRQLEDYVRLQRGDVKAHPMEQS
jgi:ribosomal subunit interface protein